MTAGVHLAYIILAHKLPDQLVRLIDRLDTPAASFFVHVDLNAGQATYERLVDRLDSRPNVHFVKRIACSWGTWSLVAAALEGLGQVIRAGIAPGHVVLLSGQDYPLKRAEEIEEFFSAYRGLSFIHCVALPDYAWRRDGGVPRLRGQALPEGFTPYRGSQWWALSGECAAYVREVADHRHELVSAYQGMDIPDEMFFQTIAANSPFRDRLTHGTLDGVECLHYIDWHAASPPKVLKAEDYHAIVSSDALFARKFDVTQDGTILDLIDIHLGISPAASSRTATDGRQAGSAGRSGQAASGPGDGRVPTAIPAEPIEFASAIVPHVINLVRPRSVVAVGGEADAWLAAFREHGITDVQGTDGDSPPEDSFHVDRTFDCAVSMGTAERFPPGRAAAFVGALANLAPVVLFSAAFPGQGGSEHPNEQWPAYWSDLFAEHGFVTIDCIRPLVCHSPVVSSRYAWNVLLCVERSVVDQNAALKALYREHGGAPLPWIDEGFWASGSDSWQAELRRMRNAWAAQADADVHDLAALLTRYLALVREAKALGDERDAWKRQAERFSKDAAALRDLLRPRGKEEMPKRKTVKPNQKGTKRTR